MKQDKPLKKVSRRSFTKAITGPLVITPLAPTLSFLHTPHATTKRTTSSPAVIKDHIPPLTFSDGSLEVEAHNLSDPGSSQSPHRQKKYKVQVSGNQKLDRVKLIVIRESRDIPSSDTGVDVVVSEFRGPSPQLKIWLEYEESPGSGRYKLVDRDNHQIEVRNESIGGINQLVLETDKKLNRTRNGHQRPEMINRNIYMHEGYDNDRLFRINKVEVVGGTKNLPTLPSGAERYKVIVLVWSKSV